MDDGTATRSVDHRRVLLDPVERFHLGAPAVRPGRDANIFFREQGCDLERLVGVVEGADLEPELARDIDHHRHLVGAVTMVLRSEEHTSELQSPMRTSYAAFC